jgi:hypothetical protein
MKEVIIDFLDALIPLGIAVLLLARPQMFTKKDLKAPENTKTAGLLKKAGIILLVAGILILISNLMTK